ncbi:MAG: hypothetical protein IPL96_03180 [Holophagaceae bacterium]|nr:hypothetical protein [Holophagaceae bacterium]
MIFSKESIMFIAIAMSVILLSTQQEASIASPKHRLEPYTAKVADLPRFVVIGIWPAVHLNSYSPLPLRENAKFVEGYQVEFITINDQRLRLPGKEPMSASSSHDEFGGKLHGDKIVFVELPEGHDAIRGFRLFGPDGKLLGEQYFNPKEQIPDVQVEVNEVGEVKFGYQGKINYWNARISHDNGKTWTKPSFPAVDRWNQLLEDSKDLFKQKPIMEITLINNFKVEKRCFILSGPQKGILTNMGYIKD